MRTVCYLSNKCDDVDETAVQGVFEVTQKNNISNNITGTLLYLNGTFLQVIEGKKEQIITIFEKIKKDDRHRNIFVVIDKKLDKRTFKNYKSGFSIIRSREDLEELARYLTHSAKDKPLTQPILNLLKPFLL